MKVISKKRMKIIEEKKEEYDRSKIIINSGKSDKDLTIITLMDDLNEIYSLLGLY